VFTSNSWHISQSDEEYKDATTFNPERYALLYNILTISRFMNENVKDVLQGHLGWGSGRRLCVGWNVGWKNMFITFSRMLYCFDFIEDPVLPLFPISPLN
jgi:cytochrome P450